MDFTLHTSNNEERKPTIGVRKVQPKKSGVCKWLLPTNDYCNRKRMIFSWAPKRVD